MDSIILSERNSSFPYPPMKVGGYLNRKVTANIVPSKNPNLSSSSASQSETNKEQRHDGVEGESTQTDSKINLNESGTDSESPNYKHNANVRVIAGDHDDRVNPSESFQAGHRDVVEGVSSNDNIPIPSPTIGTRRNHMYWKSEYGLVRMGMQSTRRHRKQQVKVTEETTDETTPTVTIAQETEDSWLTERPGTDDLTTETPEILTEGRLNYEDQNMGIFEDQSTVTPLDSSTIITEEVPVSTVEEELLTVIPEENLTVPPEDWLTTTFQGGIEWPTFLPEEEDLVDTETDVDSSASALHPTPLDFTTSSRHSTVTPTLPPSLPPTPSPQDAVEDTFRITTRGLDFLLEASPTGQSSPDTTEFPKDEFFTLDLSITTTREGLKVDARDVTLDPSQIAKATSYEGSSYPTATRSATVTTTWVEENHPTTFDHQGVVVNVRNGESVNLSNVNEKGDTMRDLRPLDLTSEIKETSTLPIDELMHQVDGLHGQSESNNNITTGSNNTTQTYNTTTQDRNFESTTSPTTVSEDTEYVTEVNSGQESSHETNTSGRSISGFPPLMIERGDTRNKTSGIVKGSNSRVEETVLYEIPVVTRNPTPQVSPSVVVALSVCCALVLVLAALSVALWVFRRHRNRSKIYLSREAAKPRAFFTRPMNPAVLPEDSDQDDTVYMFEFQRPRPPILLGDDQKGIYFIKQDDSSKEGEESLGVDNEAFTDVPLSEGGDGGKARLDPPKYDLKSKRDSDADSGIRVWSSTGSLHAAASPLPNHCKVPPPPYSTSISKESVCLTVHSLPSLPRNSQLLNV